MLIQSLVLSMFMSFTTALPPMKAGMDEFVFNNLSEPETIDPAKATGVPDNVIVVQLFEGLMDRKQDWVTLVPGQAESYKITNKGKTYTFKLRKNLKWSDGTPLTAKDFEYSWLRAINPATLNQYAYWLTDNIIGAKEYFDHPTEENAKKVGFKATDDLTFVVNLNKPVPYFLQITAESTTYPVQKANVEKFKDAFTRAGNLVSNGAYVLKEWKINDKIVLEKNPYYRDAKSVKIQRAIALPIDSRDNALKMFKAGKLDWSGHQGAPNPLIPSLQKDETLAPTLRISQGFVNYFYRVNTTRKGLDDKRVRQALVLGVDREQLVKAVTRGGEIPADTFVPPHTGSYKSPKGLTSGNFQKDLAKAKKLLEEAGYKDGKGLPTFQLQYNTDENHKRVALAVVAMWKKNLGIDVTPFNQEWKVYLKAQEQMQFDLSRSGWQGDYPDPGTFLELFTPTSGNNHTGWKNKKYGDLFEEANRTMNSTKRNQLLAKAEAMLIEDAPIIPLYFYTNYGLLRPEVVGFEPNVVDRPYIKYFSKKKS